MTSNELTAYAGKAVVVRTRNGTNYYGRVAQHKNLGVRLVMAQQIRNGRYVANVAKRVISAPAIVGLAEVADPSGALAASDALNAQLKAAAAAPAQEVAKTA